MKIVLPKTNTESLYDLKRSLANEVVKSVKSERMRNEKENGINIRRTNSK